MVARSSQPEGPGIFPPGSAVIVSPILLGMRLADRRCPEKKPAPAELFPSKNERL
jgi:hypothetical protein